MSTRPASTRRLKVASYNIRKAVGIDWRREPARVTQVIAALDADVVVLQEADKRWGERPAAVPREMIEAETDLAVVALSPDGPSLGWHGNAVLVRKDIAVAGHERLTLPGIEPRGGVVVRLENGPSVAAVHLGLRRGCRQRQLPAIMTALGEASHGESLIMGDFNEWSPDRGLEALAGSFTALSPGKSFHATFPVAGLDRIAYGRRFELADAGVDESPLARISSDHLPVWAVLETAPAAPVSAVA